MVTGMFTFFFHEKSYPEEKVLNRLFKKLSSNRVPLEKLRNELEMDEEEFDNSNQPLYFHIKNEGIRI